MNNHPRSGTILFAILLTFHATTQALTEGDVSRGRQLARECFACHGADGISPSPVNPKIGGQHEQYLLMAMQAYIDGTRQNSLMRGAVLNKSAQDLRDIAAYYAAQQPTAAKPEGAAEKTATRGGPPDVIRFDHGERTSEFTSLLARARSLDFSSPATAEQACRATDEDSLEDSDNDGLADLYDAAPNDANEFVRDTNGDGRYEICNIYQLQAIATLGTFEGTSTDLSLAERLRRSYQLADDLDAAVIDNFEPIGNCGPTGNCMRALGEFGFAGTFDGQGHIIEGLAISKPERGGVSLFGVLGETGVIMNLSLTNISIEGRAGTGGLVGSNFGVVYNCQVEGNVTGGMAIGGLVGGSGGLVFDSNAAGTVSGQQAVGGLVGDMTGAVFYSGSSSTVTGERGVGGLVGLNTFGSVLDSRASGLVTGVNDVGGLVGVNTDAKVRNSYATGDVRGKENNIGGIAGFNSLSTIRNSYALGTVTGSDSVGGLVGRNNGAVENGFATGASGVIIGAVVDGHASSIFPSPEDGTGIDLTTLDTEATGWAPALLPAVKPLNYFCDRNRNGFIDPEERGLENYIWNFGSTNDYPAIRCVQGGLQAQHD